MAISPPSPTNHTMESFDFHAKLSLFAGLAAMLGSYAFVASVASLGTANLEQYRQRVAFRDCMIERTVDACTSTYPLGSK